jgi:hypothetical protein
MAWLAGQPPLSVLNSTFCPRPLAPRPWPSCNAGPPLGFACPLSSIPELVVLFHECRRRNPPANHEKDAWQPCLYSTKPRTPDLTWITQSRGLLLSVDPEVFNCARSQNSTPRRVPRAFTKPGRCHEVLMQCFTLFPNRRVASGHLTLVDDTAGPSAAGMSPQSHSDAIRNGIHPCTWAVSEPFHSYETSTDSFRTRV